MTKTAASISQLMHAAARENSIDGEIDVRVIRERPVAKFIARVARLERRYKNDKFANEWLVPKEELIAVRDALVAPGLFGEK